MTNPPARMKPQPEAIAPPTLAPGDVIAVLAPARAVQMAQLEPALRMLGMAGYQVRLGAHALDRLFRFAGDDAARAADFNAALADPQVRAVWCARGGYGATRIADALDWKALRRRPKWIVGFSDITALLAGAVGAGVQALHAPVLAQFVSEEAVPAFDRTLAALAGVTPYYIVRPSGPYNRSGLAQGRLVGGNLSLLHTIGGTAADYLYDGAVLFIEDVEEHVFRFDRMLNALRRRGIFERLAGLIVGGLTNITDDSDDPFGFSPQEILADHVAPYQFPVLFNFPAGHQPDNFPLIMGRRVELTVNEEGGTLQFL